jgi:hypothetical protein
MSLEPGRQSSALAALDASRQRVEDRLGALRQALDSSPVGRFGGSWTLPILAAAVGFSLAMLLRRRAREARALDEETDYY